MERRFRISLQHPPALVGRLVGRFEPDRVAAVQAHLATFGARETLSQLRAEGAGHRAERMGPASVRGATVH